jgi:para-aminobenzoate synthetase / 4-amino-4-deoxychorismate lyase
MNRHAHEGPRKAALPATAGAPHSGSVVFTSRSRELHFRDPITIISTHHLDEVAPMLSQVEDHVNRGRHAAGFIAYEAAPAFDPALTVHPPSDLPLLWFGIYAEPKTLDPQDTEGGPFRVGPWEATVSQETYHETLDHIRELIAAGDTYQVNYTFRQHAEFSGDAFAYYRRLCAAQRADFCAYTDTGRFQIASASPELFFRLEGDELTVRPMKGTRPRGRFPEEDDEQARELAASAKDQAENVMIVDLLRNDVGRVSRAGSVQVPSLYDIERYPTVWQMTSTITSHCTASVPEVFRALFPSGSVTGAPKVRTMQIIRDLETTPRGVYCGTLGWWGPGRQAEFNVAIRTVTIDRQTARAEYGVGGGITWGSSPEGEYEECQAKAALLTHQEPEFELLESILLDGEFFLLDEHLERLTASAKYFGFTLDSAGITAALNRIREDHSVHGATKVRLLAARDGAFRVEAEPVKPSTPVRLGFALEPVDSHNTYLFHKTTHRHVYDAARASRPECDDVLLWNERGEITETSVANVVLEIDGELLTPPLSSGLLAGTMRGHLLARGEIQERILTKEDVTRAQSVRLINSVRKWVKADFVD